ncbi:hypothetical protein CTDIVETGP_1203 [Clostridium tyrobutyricum DIVETGP]|uniref:Uncharacterized protein n=2 Tax=Clostridium tyrobutyricum TaxID=1519 RepID=W6N3S9_CLOTY|nr:hypothetical protein [Clostridium tyrobutyricum]CDL91133.1 hypothetical protein CTDIVETGP_1203 [Clostridium tyrobutyricum DIVETGP]AND84487.1 hypothetical protein CTK_C12260 [Clostridium tyrobutyricum]MBR9647595.1 hypothetical protein [Clostridium tyrobutyricum]MBV4434880.1 hypothetical protein [Clostridium tyrobutyricum]MBV4447379.1 hypothetical protein [Clostridium tyrobutyricum]
MYGMDFFGNKLVSFQISNKNPGAEVIANGILQYLKKNSLTHFNIAYHTIFEQYL